MMPKAAIVARFAQVSDVIALTLDVPEPGNVAGFFSDRAGCGSNPV
jgi:hypothetical protein